MVRWIDQEPEFEGWPTGTKDFDGENKEYDKSGACMIQPPAEEGAEKPKPEESKSMYFECLKESYPDEMKVYNAEEIIVMEKGKDVYDTMIDDRKEREEQRRIREQSIRNPDSLFLKAQFNTEEEKKKAQERAQQRQSRTEMKEMAESVK